MNDEGLSNGWQDNTTIERELDPWLQRRLEERARPLNSRVLSTDKPALISTGNDMTGKSNRIVDSIMGRARLMPGMFQADRLPLFSRTFTGLISRTMSTGASGFYKMMNLPWFRAKRGNKQEYGTDSELISRQEMPEGSADDINNTIILPVTESVEDNRPQNPGKTPETYINYMVSSPITRKTVMNINNQERDMVLTRSSSLMRTGPAAETHNLINTEKNNRDISLVSRSIDRSTTNKEVIPDRVGIQQDNRATKTTGDFSHNKEEKGKGQIPVIDYPSSQRDDTDTRQITATDADTKTVDTIDFPSLQREDRNTGEMSVTEKDARKAEAIDYPSSQSENRNTGQITATGKDARKAETIDYPSPRREDGGKGQISATQTYVTQPDISPKSEVDKGSSVYPAKNLFYEYPSLIVRKIVRSLPFTRNIQRKEIKQNESVDQSADQRQTERSVDYRHRDNPADVSTYTERPGVTPVNLDLPASPDVNNTVTEDSHIDQEFPDAGHEDNTFEPQKPNKASIYREIRPAYPVKDLFYRKPLTLTGRLIQSLPLVRNIQPKPILSRESVKQPGDRKQSELGENFRPQEDPGIVDRYEVDARANKPVQDLSLASRAITSEESESHRNRILPGDSPVTGPDFVTPVNHSLDLTLAPAGRMPAIQRQSEYSRIDPSSAEPMIARLMREARTAGTQQTETSEETETQQTETSGQAETETQQTETSSDETQQSETSEQAATGTQSSSSGNNENMLDYRTIARETYPFIRRMIMVERERRPSR